MENRERLWTEDGREAEKIVKEIVGTNGETSIVTEFHVEPKVEKKLARRVVETVKPMIHTREIETFDEGGTVVSKVVESVDNNLKVQGEVSAQSVEDCDCAVTRDELKEAMTMFADTLAVRLNGNVSAQSVPATVSMQSVVEERVNAEGMTWNTMLLWGMIACTSATLAWALFVR